MPDNVEVDSLITVVFVQDKDSKDIYQAAYAKEYSTITSVDELIESNVSSNSKIYPNPVKDLLSLRVNKSVTNNLNVYIFNSTGEKVKTEKLLSGNELLEISTNELPAGIYYIQITGSSELIAVRKFIKID